MSETTAILLTLVVYKLVLLGIGVYTQRRNSDEVDFYLGGRSLGPFVAALSASASSSSAWSLLGVTGAAWAWGLGAVWLFPACWLGFLFNWAVLAPALQRHANRTRALTVIDVVAGDRSQPWARTVAGVCAVVVALSFSVYVAAQFQGAGKTFAEVFGLHSTEAIVLGAVIIVLYTLMGGFWAVALSDALQGLTMVVAAVLVPLASLWAVGGPVGLWAGLAAVEAEGFLSLTRGMPAASALGFVAGTLGIGLGYPGQPHVANRFMAMEARPGAMVTGRRVALTWATLLYGGTLVTGWCGRVLFPDVVDAEQVFLMATSELFPPVLAGVMVAAVLSAIMSTADSQLLVAASSVTHDLGLAGGSARQRLLRSRLVMVGVAAFSVGLALYGDATIFSRVLFAWSVVGSALGPVLLINVLSRPVRPPWALVAVLLGAMGSATAYQLDGTRGTWVERILPFVLACLVAWLGRKPAESPPAADLG